MTDNDPDTTTPLDGDGHNVTSPSPVAIPAFPNAPEGEYETRGKTTVATRRGYAFASNDLEIPVITHQGLRVTKTQAEALVEESNGEVFIRNDESEED